MLGFLLRRLGIAVCVAITVSIISFLFCTCPVTATAIGGPEASSEQIEQIRAVRFDKPLPTQYFNWLGDLLRLDLGDSFFFQESVYNLIASRLPITLSLGAMALGIALVVAIPLGVLAAVKRDTD